MVRGEGRSLTSPSVEELVATGALVFFWRPRQPLDSSESIMTDMPSGMVSLGNSHVPNAIKIRIKSTRGKLRGALRAAVARLKRNLAWNHVWESIIVTRGTHGNHQYVVTFKFRESFVYELE